MSSLATTFLPKDDDRGTEDNKRTASVSRNRNSKARDAATTPSTSVKLWLPAPVILPGRVFSINDCKAPSDEMAPLVRVEAVDLAIVAVFNVVDPVWK